MENKFKEVDERFCKEVCESVPIGVNEVPVILDFIHSELDRVEKEAYLKFTKFILDDIAERAEFDLDWEEVEKCLNYSILEIKKEGDINGKNISCK